MMTLEKEKWERVKLESIFKLKSGNALPKSQIIAGNIPVYGGNGIVGNHNQHLVEKPTIVIGRVGEYCGSVHLTHEKAWITDNGLYPVEYFKEIDNYFLKDILKFSNLNQFAQKTGQPSISQTILNSIEIPFPPLSEQKQIASLFQSIETAIEAVEKEEERLKALKTEILRGIFGEARTLGTFLKSDDFEEKQFETLVYNISERVEPKQTELKVYVGLEHLDPENLRIERTGTPDDVIGIKLKIYKGDIIFGKRRAYQRKVAVSHFDGIASAHSMILRANSTEIEKDFLPYFMQSDEFMNRAVQISEGSLSPTIKWKTLASQTFSIPKKEKQKELISLFQKFETTFDTLKAQKVKLKQLKQQLLNEILG